MSRAVVRGIIEALVLAIEPRVAAVDGAVRVPGFRFQVPGSSVTHHGSGSGLQVTGYSIIIPVLRANRRYGWLQRLAMRLRRGSVDLP